MTNGIIIDIKKWEKLKGLVNDQIEDRGIWSNNETAKESYLKNEIRKLHAIIEDDPIYD